MVLVFILLGTFIILVSFAFLILVSTLHIEIRNLEATNINKNPKEQRDMCDNSILRKSSTRKEKDNGYAIIVSLHLGNKLKWISIHLNNEKLRKAYSKMQLEKIDIKKLEQDFKWEDLKVIKKLQPKLSYLNLNIILGTKSPATTALLVAIFSSAISFSLPYIATQIKKENYNYIIQPVYKNQNIYKIEFNCIIQVKMVHIINAIYMFIKKGSRGNERTTSNRRINGYSYE